MSTMVERVAQALDQADLENPTFEAMARAAIAATRKPTLAMIEAALMGRDVTISAAVCENIWQVMVDASLSG